LPKKWTRSSILTNLYTGVQQISHKQLTTVKWEGGGHDIFISLISVTFNKKKSFQFWQENKWKRLFKPLSNREVLTSQTCKKESHQVSSSKRFLNIKFY
jgi:hypothetical protein